MPDAPARVSITLYETNLERVTVMLQGLVGPFVQYSSYDGPGSWRDSVYRFDRIEPLGSGPRRVGTDTGLILVGQNLDEADPEPVSVKLPLGMNLTFDEDGRVTYRSDYHRREGISHYLRPFQDYRWEERNAHPGRYTPPQPPQRHAVTR